MKTWIFVFLKKEKKKKKKICKIKNIKILNL